LIFRVFSAETGNGIILGIVVLAKYFFDKLINSRIFCLFLEYELHSVCNYTDDETICWDEWIEIYEYKVNLTAECLNLGESYQQSKSVMRFRPS
jgi:hypothetical protein